MWHLWWTNCHWGRFSPSTSVSPNNRPVSGWCIPSGLSLTPPKAKWGLQECIPHIKCDRTVLNKSVAGSGIPMKLMPGTFLLADPGHFPFIYYHKNIAKRNVCAHFYSYTVIFVWRWWNDLHWPKEISLSRYVNCTLKSTNKNLSQVFPAFYHCFSASH
jgi:hypothetical protein